MKETVIHCYIKYGGSFIEIIENDGQKRCATAYRIAKRELEFLKEDIEKVLRILNMPIEEDIPQF